MILGFLFDNKDKKKYKVGKKQTKPAGKKKLAAKTKIKFVSRKENSSVKAVSKKEKNIQKTGKVTHYFPKVKAAAIKIIKGPIEIGDTIYIKGATTDFKQRVASMQIEHKPIKSARKGDSIGLKVKQRTRKRDLVFKEF